LSYFLWNTMPDDALFAAAGDGSLGDVAAVEAQVDRMLADPKAADAVQLFHLQWLKVYNLSSLEKSTELYPNFDASTIAAMQNEVATFSDYVVRQGDGLMGTLFQADFSFIEPVLAEYYGVTAPAAGQSVTFPAGERAGVLTQAAFLARHAH